MPNPLDVITRRSFLGKVAVATAASTTAVSAPGRSLVSTTSMAGGSTLLDVLRVPDRATAFAGLAAPVALSSSPHSWQANGIEVEFQREAGEMAILLTSPAQELTHVHVRWLFDVPGTLRCLGDHWERSYGDLAWRGIVPERVMPWYFLTWDGATCHGYGVKTGAGALCFWQVDGEGVSLWMNLSNGGDGVRLGSRRLHAATIVSRAGMSGEAPIESARAFCRMMSEKPRLPASPLYGSNDWYYAYGKNSAEQTLRDADLMAELTSGLGARPFTVIDDGWRDASRFPDMRSVAAEIKRRNVRAGIWIRPLIAPSNTAQELLLPGARFGKQRERASELAYDPTVPEALELITAKAKEVVEFGFELVKHDYSITICWGAGDLRWGPARPLPDGICTIAHGRMPRLFATFTWRSGRRWPSERCC